ncbi:AraC family transcriptional regulator [Serratia ureilytica]
MKSYLHDNFAEAVTLNQLAERVSLSPYHFLRKFKGEYHVSPQQMLDGDPAVGGQTHA